ncbi:hypothetical protein A2316_01270 [Candidatus Falkowbacteria bacterium RIFOXYB2_FULL_38_15]|uniref:Kazal-like domain-containing protein n=1 Tax=Candidatus Falkowbacteria bacterium RIFOXYA2_FULL_38_12 TaxID=1797993 RepID=A0A1F5S4P1_9BACT|nr:MAG: hypothetical protein A2257_02670 [Candidatus Falkowbacteria bacterium RIFOXYA2_FULL_38_12]OGF32811.1 MAG: hypothetical protein A2316_01270 [Candidatus Falkowbacteria bacterium RIFOXYB2_FULL_38_15]OGF42151.1 MAG: hypothetical protein A2555_02615 [Candidatus Falkowbacteria bacterium RIFOXYD2_FULL_39_16]
MKKSFLLLVCLLAVFICSGCDQKSNTEKLEKNEEAVDISLPDENELDVPQKNNDCESACINYVNKCLTLVPNANQALYNDGVISCMKECIDWDSEKADCMINAIDCPSMTDVCGL